MRLIIASEIFPPDIGGPATYVTRIVPEFLKAGWEVKVITYADVKKVATESQLGYEVIKIPRNNILSKFIIYIKELNRLAKQADLIYAQGPIASGLPSLIVKWLAGKKVIMKIVGDVAWERARNRYDIKELTDEFQNKKYSLAIEFGRWLEHFIVRQMDKVIVPSQYLKKIVGQFGAKPDKIQVIYNALEEIDCNLSKEQARVELGYSGKILFSMARLAPWKGYEALINIMPRLEEKFTEIKLVIVGDGPMFASLKSQVLSLKLEDYVELVGSVPHEETGKYFKAADLFVLNTGYEGLSHVLLETLSMKLPAVVSNIGGNPEVIEDGKNGYLFEFDNKEEMFNKICDLLSNGVKQKEFVEAGSKKLEQFTFKRMIDETKEQLKSMIKT